MDKPTTVEVSGDYLSDAFGSLDMQMGTVLGRLSRSEMPSSASIRSRSIGQLAELPIRSFTSVEPVRPITIAAVRRADGNGSLPVSTISRRSGYAIGRQFTLAQSGAADVVLAPGVDPDEERERLRREPASPPIVGEDETYLERRSAGWGNPDHARLPVFGMSGTRRTVPCGESDTYRHSFIVPVRYILQKERIALVARSEIEKGEAKETLEEAMDKVDEIDVSSEEVRAKIREALGKGIPEELLNKAFEISTRILECPPECKLVLTLLEWFSSRTVGDTVATLDAKLIAVNGDEFYAVYLVVYVDVEWAIRCIFRVECIEGGEVDNEF